MNFKNITLAGSGVLGYQIAFQSAFHGYNVTVYDISDKVLEKAKGKFEGLKAAYKRDLKATEEQLQATYENLNYQSNLAEAVKDADLMIEAIPENPKIKIEFYEKLAKVAPEKTVFATNSSTLLPSQFAAHTGRPSKFLALHFANEIWKHNTAEVMGHSQTDPEVFQAIVDIDKTWMKGTGAPLGPVAILDIIGITTMYNINKNIAEQTQDPLMNNILEYLQDNFIKKNKLGVSTGEGFYSYPNPNYQKADFLK
ncbi:3-hydroxyacyl-CoA dehydrogenase [Echinicola marina]|nr:3-hydroxyacyl-CoA dehydrogenase [Echinicola marina]